jgi:hypothetical protein
MKERLNLSFIILYYKFGGKVMSKDFMNLNEEYRTMYQNTINQMLIQIADDNRFEDTIRNLCNQALINNWELEKKINIINIVTNN